MMKPTTKQRKGTKKHIAKVCLEVYEKVLEEGKKDNLERFKYRLIKCKADFGVCFLYEVKTKCAIGHKSHISIHKNCSSKGLSYGSFWFKVPYHPDSKKEAIDLIKKEWKS